MDEVKLRCVVMARGAREAGNGRKNSLGANIISRAQWWGEHTWRK